MCFYVLAKATLWLAEIGGYTGKSSGGPPSSTTLARGLAQVQAAVRVLWGVSPSRSACVPAPRSFRGTASHATTQRMEQIVVRSTLDGTIARLAVAILLTALQLNEPHPRTETTHVVWIRGHNTLLARARAQDDCCIDDVGGFHHTTQLPGGAGP